MIFEDAFTEKQSEIISMFLEVIGDNVDTIYVFIQSDEWSAMETCAFGVKGSILGNLEAGISNKDILEIFDVIEDEIIPELEDICKEYDMPMPQEFRYVYNVASGAFDSNYRYGEELSALEDYNSGIEAQKWIDSFKV